MALALGSKIIGTYAFFFRDGDAYTVPGAGTTAREDKPGATDPAWIDLGIIEDAKDNLEQEEKEIFKPVPGRLALWQILRTKAKLKLTFTASELCAFAIELGYRSEKLTAASTQFNPLSGDLSRQGWLKCQRYDGDNNAVLVLDAFVDIKLTGDLDYGGSEIIKPTYEAMVLHSTLNTATL